ncbi:hypothetical protein HYR54_05390 [Candidatus Acetothermia bacterium]|nr:hypothetical protein [Candidatus Acetothermia bacterium]
MKLFHPDLNSEDHELLRALVRPRRVKELLALGLGGSAAAATRRVTLDRQLKRLIQLGLVEKPRHGLYQLTESGRKTLARSGVVEVQPHWSDPQLRAFLDLWPVHYQAFLRLLLSALTAKQLFPPELFPKGWPLFVIAGRTAGLKTTAGDALGTLLNLSRPQYYRLLPQLAPGEVLGHHVQLKGGQRSFQPSPLFDLPLAVLDEWDKSDPEVQRRALLFGHGERELTVEGQTLANRATALLLLNCEWEGSLPLPEEYVRRAIVLDLRPLQRLGELGDVPTIARRISTYLDEQPIRLNLGSLGSTAAPAKLADSEFQLLRDLIRPRVREERLVDYLGLEILILGYECFVKDRLAALFGVAFDWLRVSETRGAVVEGWAETFLSTWKQRGPLAPEQARAVAVAQSQQAQLKQRQHEQAAQLKQLHQEELRQPARRAARKQHLVGRLQRLIQYLQKQLRLLQREAPEQIGEQVASLEVQVNAILAGLRQHIRQLRSARAQRDLAQWEEIVNQEEQAAATLQGHLERSTHQIRDWKRQTQARAEELEPSDRMIAQIERYLNREVRSPRENWVQMLAQLGCLKEIQQRCYGQKVRSDRLEPSGPTWQRIGVTALNFVSALSSQMREERQLSERGTVEVEVQVNDEQGKTLLWHGRPVTREKLRLSREEYNQLLTKGSVSFELHYYVGADGKPYPLDHFDTRDAPRRARPLLQHRLAELKRERSQAGREVPAPQLLLPPELQ